MAEQATKIMEKVGDAAPEALTKAIPMDIPPQHQSVHPGVEHEMKPRPVFISDDYRGSGKLQDKVALITGGDSGIGRSVAVHFAREGAKGIAIAYKASQENQDAKETVELVEKEGSKCLAMQADVGDPDACKRVVDATVTAFGQIDVLVNNAAEQYYHHSITEISNEELDRVYATNIFSFFYLSQACLPHLKPGSSILNCASVTAFMGYPELLHYATTKGAIVSFTRSLAGSLIERGIRVNAVCPGPVWTPLIPSSFPKVTLPAWQKGVPMQRAGQPSEVGPSFVFLASEDASFFTGQALHPNGGVQVNS